MNTLIVFLAAVVSFLIGMAWYSDKMFGPSWRKEIGVTHKGKVELKDMRKYIIAGFVLDLFVASSFGFLLALTTSGPFYLAFFGWFGFMMPVIFASTVWEGRSLNFAMLNSGYRLVSLFGMAIVFSFM